MIKFTPVTGLAIGLILGVIMSIIMGLAPDDPPVGERGPKKTDQYITVASTSSTQNSGLFDHILPKFKAVSGI